MSIFYRRLIMRKAQYTNRTSVLLSNEQYLKAFELSELNEISLGEAIRRLIETGIKMKETKIVNNDEHAKDKNYI